jgi:RNA polymerase sigma factor (sigma-70 family)
MPRPIDEEVLPGQAEADPGVSDSGVQWMLRYQAGDERAFDRLVEEYSPRVYALLTRFLGPASNREDLVQDVFLRVIRTRATYAPDARFSTWLYRIVFNLCVNAVERRSPPRSSASGGEGELDWPDERTPHWRCSSARTRARGARRSRPCHRASAWPWCWRSTRGSLEEVAGVLGSSEGDQVAGPSRAETLREWLAPFLEEEVA